jgi:hypothetical protein
MFMCLFFVFASLLEFAYINVLARRRFPYSCVGGGIQNTLEEGQPLQTTGNGVSHRGVRLKTVMRAFISDDLRGFRQELLLAACDHKGFAMATPKCSNFLS